jgi:hypothetical protein
MHSGQGLRNHLFCNELVKKLNTGKGMVSVIISIKDDDKGKELFIQGIDTTTEDINRMLKVA